MRRTPSTRRFHIVLVPGFGAFDALGQLEYYAGVTHLFRKWLTGNVVLHYFDNYPTAAVVTRAMRLRSYLAKRMVRGEISTDDEVTLVGHSTGGLDIRCLLWDLNQKANRRIAVDGGLIMPSGQILRCVRRVVFLSVPHWGTNIADWVLTNWGSRKDAVRELRIEVARSQQLLLDQIRDLIAGGADRLPITGGGLFGAVRDALVEANENTGRPSRVRQDEAHEAASELGLYLRQMASDFGALHDLACQAHDPERISPAHFNAHQRAVELKLCRDIEFLSYLTVGKRPFRFLPGSPAPSFELANPWTYREIIKDAALNPNTDLVYRICYRVCAGGPFLIPVNTGKIMRRLNRGPQQPNEVWDNDGIVNTLSMLWPKGENVLVSGDHMDVVGHYIARRATSGGGRMYVSYDLLRSESRFDGKAFEKLWQEIFEFSAHGSRPYG